MPTTAKAPPAVFLEANLAKDNVLFAHPDKTFLNFESNVSGFAFFIVTNLFMKGIEARKSGIPACAIEGVIETNKRFKDKNKDNLF